MDLFLPDTNILIYGLMDKKPYGEHLSTWIKDKSLALSSIVVAEYLSGATSQEAELFEALLDKFGSLPIDTSIARIAASYRKKYKKKVEN